jgi:hypothetical protein
MKITSNFLRNLINKEIQNVLKEEKMVTLNGETMPESEANRRMAALGAGADAAQKAMGVTGKKQSQADAFADMNAGISQKRAGTAPNLGTVAQKATLQNYAASAPQAAPAPQADAFSQLAPPADLNLIPGTNADVASQLGAAAPQNIVPIDELPIPSKEETQAMVAAKKNKQPASTRGHQDYVSAVTNRLQTTLANMGLLPQSGIDGKFGKQTLLAAQRAKDIAVSDLTQEKYGEEYPGAVEQKQKLAAQLNVLDLKTMSNVNLGQLDTLLGQAAKFTRKMKINAQDAGAKGKLGKGVVDPRKSIAPALNYTPAPVTPQSPSPVGFPESSPDQLQSIDPNLVSENKKRKLSEHKNYFQKLLNLSHKHD